MKHLIRGQPTQPPQPLVLSFNDLIIFPDVSNYLFYAIILTDRNDGLTYKIQVEMKLIYLLTGHVV